MNRVTVMGETDIISAINYARICAFRWDVFPYSLLVDMDIPASKKNGDEYQRRAWVCFVGADEMTINCKGARIPAGIFLSDGAGRYLLNEKFFSFQCYAYLPAYGGGSRLLGPCVETLEVVAMNAYGAVSEQAALTQEFGGLSYQDRNSLATDAELYDALVKFAGAESRPCLKDMSST